MSNFSEYEEDRQRRWRLVLGGGESDGIGTSLSPQEDAVDRAISALYDGELGQSSDRRGGSEGSYPRIANWLGDIRTYFPSSVVQVMQQDALERFNLKQLLFEPEMLEAIVPDIHLVTTLMALKNLIPDKTRSTARMVVKKVVDSVMQRLQNQLRQAVTGTLNRSIRNNHPKHNEIDWHRTIRLNLKNYQPEYKSIVPERMVGFGRRRSSLCDIILCVDQSGSMAESVVYAAVFGAVLASLPAVNTRLLAFDTAVADLSESIADPVDVLFGVQLGGGTDIAQVLSAAQSLVRRPSETILVLISDLYEGSSNSEQLLKRASALKASGVNLIVLLALSDSGAPSFDQNNASALAALQIPCFAATPDLFPDLIATAIGKRDLFEWASRNELNAVRAPS